MRVRLAGRAACGLRATVSTGLLGPVLASRRNLPVPCGSADRDGEEKASRGNEPQIERRGDHDQTHQQYDREPARMNIERSHVHARQEWPGRRHDRRGEEDGSCCGINRRLGCCDRDHPRDDRHPRCITKRSYGPHAYNPIAVSAPGSGMSPIDAGSRHKFPSVSSPRTVV